MKVITAPPLIERFTGNGKTSSNSSKKSAAEYYVIRGNNLTVNCDVLRGIPYPQISWKKILVSSFLNFWIRLDYNYLFHHKKKFYIIEILLS